MSKLKIPVTATSSKEWVRRTADGVNGLITQTRSLDQRATDLEAFQATATTEIADLDARDTALEGRADALETRATALESRDTALEARTTALETFAALPFAVDSVRFKPVTLPSSPGKGTVAFDQSDNRLKCWDGTVWQPLF
jgi:hypothetical protein